METDLSDAATDLGMPGTTEAGTGKEAFSLTAFRGRWPCQHFDFRTSGHQNCDSIDSCCFKPLICYGGPRKWIRVCSWCSFNWKTWDYEGVQSTQETSWRTQDDWAHDIKGPRFGKDFPGQRSIHWLNWWINCDTAVQWYTTQSLEGMNLIQQHGWVSK